MKRFFAKIHLWLFIPVGLFLAIICLTGASLVFEQEITRALNGDLYQVEVPRDQSRLTPSQLEACIRKQTGDSLTLASLQYAGNPEEACLATFRQLPRKTLSIDPYTGEVKGWLKSYSFFQTMRKLHRWLLDAPAQKGASSTGKLIVGVSTLLMVFILISGMVIWVPRTRKALKNRLNVSVRKGWRRFWYDTHVALGFYSFLFLLVMALTGLTWSFRWYRTAAYSLFGGGQSAQAASPASASGHDSSGKKNQEGKERKRKQTNYIAWDQAWQELQISYPEYKSITLSNGTAQIAPDPSASMRRNDTAGFDPNSGEIIQVTHYKDLPRANKLKGWFYAFHTGSWGGTITKVLYFLAALIGGTLPLTGYWLWLKKKSSRRSGKRIPATDCPSALKIR